MKVNKKTRKYAWKLDKMVKRGVLSPRDAQLAFAVNAAVSDSVKRIEKSQVARVTKTRTASVTKSAAAVDKSVSVQGNMTRMLERTWRTSENPAEREAAYSALMDWRNGGPGVEKSGRAGRGFGV